MAIASIAAPVSSALQAYQSSAGVGSSAFAELTGANVAGLGGSQRPAIDFGDMVTRALQGTIDTGHTAEQAATQAVKGDGNLIDVVSAVSKAELSLQTTIAVRDRVVSAYQDIMRMAI
jgi:flagellar hook-basal body complex protein FliE